MPSRTGAEGPPRPVRRGTASRSPRAATNSRLVREQNRAVLDGPFPRGGLTRGVSEGALTLDPDSDACVQARVRTHPRNGVDRCAHPVDWRDLVAPDPAASFDARDPASPEYRFVPLDAAVRDAVAAGLTPLLVVSHAPAFAEAPARWAYAYPGSWSPNPAALEDVRRRARQPLRRLLRRSAGPGLDAAAGAADAGVERAQPRALPRAPVGCRGRALERILTIHLPRTAQRVLCRRQVRRAERCRRHRGRRPRRRPDGVGRMAPMRFLRELLCLPPGPRRERHNARTRPISTCSRFTRCRSATPTCPRCPRSTSPSPTPRRSPGCSGAPRACTPHCQPARSRTVGHRAELGKRAAISSRCP